MQDASTKLGLKPDLRGCVIQRPETLAALLPLAAGPDPAADVTLCFVTRQAEIKAMAVQLIRDYRPGTRLWFAYPKKSGSIASDITRDIGWRPLIDRDFLPVTQIAIDADWSALRFRPRGEIAKLTRKTAIGGG